MIPAPAVNSFVILGPILRGMKKSGLWRSGNEVEKVAYPQRLADLEALAVLNTNHIAISARHALEGPDIVTGFRFFGIEKLRFVGFERGDKTVELVGDIDDETG